MLPAEGEELTSERSGALGSVGDLLCRSAQRGIVGESLQQELGVSGDHHEQIVEIVCNSAREAPDGFHFLGLTKLLFEGATLSDVLGEELV